MSVHLCISFSFVDGYAEPGVSGATVSSVLSESVSGFEASEVKNMKRGGC